MNKYQARCQLLAGYKITHAHFLPGQYLRILQGAVVTEDDFPVGNAPYNPFGYGAPIGAPPLQGWEIFEPENKEE